MCNVKHLTSYALGASALCRWEWPSLSLAIIIDAAYGSRSIIDIHSRQAVAPLQHKAGWVRNSAILSESKHCVTVCGAVWKLMKMQGFSYTPTLGLWQTLPAMIHPLGPRSVDEPLDISWHHPQLWYTPQTQVPGKKPVKRQLKTVVLCEYKFIKSIR
jgi:hypothetical protein